MPGFLSLRVKRQIWPSGFCYWRAFGMDRHAQTRFNQRFERDALGSCSFLGLLKKRLGQFNRGFHTGHPYFSMGYILADLQGSTTQGSFFKN